MSRRVLRADQIPFGGPRQPKPEPLSEAGAAERFARLHGHEVRFDHRRQRWLLWDQNRWRSDTDAQVIRLGLAFIRQWKDEANCILDHQTQQTTWNFVHRYEQRHALTSLLQFASAMTPIADSGERWDADPWLLACSNGIVDLRTGEIRDGHPDDRLTMSTAVPFDAAARCPRWEQFIAEVFDHYAELIDFVHRAIGYSLTGITTEQCLFLCYGTGANGKGTLAKQMIGVLADYAFNMPFSTIELHQRASIPNDLAALLGRRFVVASETNDGTRLNEARLKALTGCDPVTARFLHGEFFTFEPVAKFWLAVNHKPVVRDDSYGFWRRIRLIPFTRTFDVDMSLAGSLSTEAPGILAWAVRGCQAWQRDGLRAPAIVTEATQAYERDSDPLSDFLAEACQLDPLSVTRAGEFYAHYVRWADRGQLRKEDRLNKTSFGRKATERFRKDSDNRGSFYSGVRVASFPQ